MRNPGLLSSTPGLLSSGGGTADRCIRFWNTLTGSPVSCIDTVSVACFLEAATLCLPTCLTPQGSQVCNLMWSKNVNEIVSTHGYSLNQIIVWKYPSMQPLATLTGHTYRVLYLALSPDGKARKSTALPPTLQLTSSLRCGRPNHRHGRGRRNTALLERFPLLCGQGLRAGFQALLPLRFRYSLAHTGRMRTNCTVLWPMAANNHYNFRSPGRFSFNQDPLSSDCHKPSVTDPHPPKRSDLGHARLGQLHHARAVVATASLGILVGLAV